MQFHVLQTNSLKGTIFLVKDLIKAKTGAEKVPYLLYPDTRLAGLVCRQLPATGSYQLQAATNY